MICPHCGETINNGIVDPNPTPLFVNLNNANGCNPALFNTLTFTVDANNPMPITLNAAANGCNPTPIVTTIKF